MFNYFNAFENVNTSILIFPEEHTENKSQESQLALCTWRYNAKDKQRYFSA